MYLPFVFIEKLLRKNSYTEYSKLYVSSENRKTKHYGSIFNFVAKELNISPKQFLHIGDNYYSDYKQARKHKWNSIYIPSNVKILKKNKRLRKFWKDDYIDVMNEGSNIGLKSASIGIIANILFSNPNNRNINPSSIISNNWSNF